MQSTQDKDSDTDSDTTEVFRPASKRCGTVGAVNEIDAKIDA
jgi:hypothetical protein